MQLIPSTHCRSFQIFEVSMGYFSQRDGKQAIERNQSVGKRHCNLLKSSTTICLTRTNMSNFNRCRIWWWKLNCMQSQFTQRILLLVEDPKNWWFWFPHLQRTQTLYRDSAAEIQHKHLNLRKSLNSHTGSFHLKPFPSLNLSWK